MQNNLPTQPFGIFSIEIVIPGVLRSLDAFDAAVSSGGSAVVRFDSPSVRQLSPVEITSRRGDAAWVSLLTARKKRLHCVRKRKRIRLIAGSGFLWSRPHRIIVNCRWIRGSDPPAAHGVPHETGARTIPALWAASAEVQVGVTQGPSPLVRVTCPNQTRRLRVQNLQRIECAFEQLWCAMTAWRASNGSLAQNQLARAASPSPPRPPGASRGRSNGLRF